MITNDFNIINIKSVSQNTQLSLKKIQNSHQKFDLRNEIFHQHNFYDIKKNEYLFNLYLTRRRYGL